MKKTLTAIAAALILTVASVAAPQQADARSRHGHGHGHGGSSAGALIGGLAFGALLGAASANNGYYYAPRRAYSDCYWATERYWNGWRWRHQRVRVCD